VSLLRALGLAESEPFRLCKAGEPCILQVGATRIGVSRTVASQIFVIPDPHDR
jgi:Fe2+ transport system protein FeoA